MKFTIYFPLKALSINSTYYGNKNHGKTAAAKEWTLEASRRINSHSSDFEKLRNYFDPKKHVYKIYLEMHVPIDVLYTKSGELTSKVVDITNYEKSLVDILMLKKFYPEVSNLNTDDRYLMYITSGKIPTEKYWGLQATIEITDKPTTAVKT